MSGLLDEILARVKSLPPDVRKQVLADAQRKTRALIWVPNPGPQRDAFDCEADELFYGGQAGGGKLLDLDTKLPTPYGWTTMGQVAVGDRVIDEQGNPCNVVAKSGVVLSEPAYLLEFSDGSKIVAGARHQWLTSSALERYRAWGCTDTRREKRRANRPLRGTGKRPDLALRNTNTVKPSNLPLRSIRTTVEIVSTLTIGLARVNHAIDVCAPLQLPSVPLLIDPYVLGAWLGDGSQSSGSITGLDDQVFQQVANSYHVVRHTDGRSHGVHGLMVDLKHMGVFQNKHIPDAYLRASVDQRLALLQGLMDTDGYCDERGMCEFTQVRKRLAMQASELLHSLGIKHNIREGLAKLDGRITGPNFRIKFLTELPVFRLSRKLLRQKRHGFRGTHAQRYIVGATSVATVPMQCIQVDSPNHMYLCGEAMIPTHNSDLSIGLALTRHKRSLLLRRQNKDAKELAERTFEILGTRDGYNGQDHWLRLPGGRLIDYSGCNLETDKQNWKGKPHDFVSFDELPDFLESQYTFIIGWNRSANPKQRCRVVCTGNPPTQAEGLWVIRRWGPWLDPTHPKPAKPGELRWYTTINGKDTEVDGPGPHKIDGEEKPVIATSRTFIRAKLADNPDLAATNYDAKLAAMPEELRKAYREGRFDAGLKDKPFQIVPTAWVRAAIERWTQQPPEGVPMCAMAIDASGGGDDPMVIGWRHDGWYAPFITVPGDQVDITRMGQDTAGKVIGYRRNKAVVIIDLGGGYGLPAFEHLKTNLDTDRALEPMVFGFKGSEGSNRRSQDHQFGFNNKRTEALWRFREALDPGQAGGSPIMLPNDPEMISDLTAVTYEVRGSIIHAEAKEKVCERLGRSTDKGDTVCMGWTAGPIASTHGAIWDEVRRNMEHGLQGRRPSVVMGRHNARR